MKFFYFAPYKNYKILFQTKLGCSGKGIYEAHGRVADKRREIPLSTAVDVRYDTQGTL